MAYSNVGILDIPDIGSEWAPEAEVTMAAPRRRLRAPAIERLRPALRTQFATDDEVEHFLDEAEIKQETARLSDAAKVAETIGAGPEADAYIGDNPLGRLRAARAAEGRTSASTMEYLNAAAGAGAYTIGGLPGLAAEGVIGAGLNAAGVNTAMRSRDAEGNVKPLGAQDLALTVGSEVAGDLVAPAVLKKVGPVVKDLAGAGAEAAVRQADEGVGALRAAPEFGGVRVPGGAEEPLSDFERQVQASLRGQTPAREPLKSVGEMRTALADAGLDSTGTPSAITNRYRGMQAKAKGGIGTPTENVSNAARDAYSRTLEQTGDPEAARLAAQKAAAQEGASNTRAGALSRLMDDLGGGERGAVTPEVATGGAIGREAPATDVLADVPQRGPNYIEFPPDYQGVQPSLIGNEDHNGIIEAFKTSLAGKAKELKSSGALVRSITSRIGGDLEDPYLAEMVNSEAGLRHALIQQSTKDLPPIDVRGLDPEVQAVAVKNLTSKLESIIKEAENGVTRFRNDALDARYGNTPDRAVAHGTLVANDSALSAPSKAGSVIDTTQGLLKEMVLGADIGVTLQQGLKAARVGSTSLATSVLGHTYERIGQALGKGDGALGLYPNTAISPQAQRAADGLIERGAEAVGIARGEISDTSVRRGVGDAITNKLLPAGENRAVSAVKAPFRTAGAGVQKLTDVQYAALNKVRVQIYEGRLYQAKLLGQDISEGSQARRAAAEFANLATSTARTASDAGRALIERRVLLTPQMTRSQFAELAQPLKSLQSPSQALNTVNQLASTAAVFATAYAINEELGVTTGAKNFAQNTANPLSKNFGKIVLKSRDADGNHHVWNFLPQFSAANAVLKSVRATKKAAEGDLGAKQALEQIGTAAGSFGVGRLNSGLSDLAKAGGLGYDQDGKFHWGTMPLADRAKGVLPVPLSAQSTIIQGQTDPVSVASNVLGGNVYGESAYGALDRAAQAEGFEDFSHATPLVQARLKADPNVQKALAANPSEYKQAQTRREDASEEIQVAKRAEANFARTPPEKPLRDIWHDEGIARKTIAQDLEDQFAKQFSGFSKSKYEKAVEGYYAVEKRTTQGNIDFDATQAARDDYLQALPADQREWISESLQVGRQNKTPLHAEYLDYIDAKKKLGYYRDGITAREREAIDAAHPELDVQSWKFGATTTQAGPGLQSLKAVDDALAAGLPNRPIKYAGIDRPINESEGTLALWKVAGPEVDLYVQAGTPAIKDAIARTTYKGRTYEQLTAEEQRSVRDNVRGSLLKDPQLEAELVWLGALKKPSSGASLRALQALVAQYGPLGPE